MRSLPLCCVALFAASAPDYVAISTGKLKGQLAFMTGRIEASGHLAPAMKMQSIFRGPA